MEVFGVIYLVIDGTNDFEYVGQTTKTVEKRFKEHMKSPYFIGRAIRKHGAENFVIVTLKECASKEELDRFEKYFIKSRNTKHPNGYNLAEGGCGSSGWKPNSEQLAKLAAAHRGKKLTPFSPEHCAKISAAKRGKNHPFFGKHHTLEHCKNISAGKLGKKRPPEHVAKFAAAQRLISSYKILQAEIMKQNLTYKTLAPVIGLSRRSFSNRMSGRYNFKAEEMSAVKNFLGVNISIEELFKREDF